MISAEPEPREIAAGASRFSYLENGTGPALVLLHGIGSGARSWAMQLHSMAKGCRVIAWDAPGYGSSDLLPRDEPDASDYARALLSLLDKLGVYRCHLVGHSLGCIMAARFARLFPDNVERLTLASPSGGHLRLADHERRALRESRLSDLAALGPQAMARKRGPRLVSDQAPKEIVERVIATMARIREDGYRRAVGLLSRSDTQSDLETVSFRTPTQIIYGELDIVTTPASILKMTSSCTCRRIDVIKGAGHAVYLEKAQEFEAALRDFRAESA